MKKAIGILLTLSVLLSVCACSSMPGKPNHESTSPEAADKTAPPTDETAAPVTETVTEVNTGSVTENKPADELCLHWVVDPNGGSPTSPYTALISGYTESDPSLAQAPLLEYTFPTRPIEKNHAVGTLRTVDIPALEVSLSGGFVTTYWDEGHVNPVDIYSASDDEWKTDLSVDTVTGQVITFTRSRTAPPSDASKVSEDECSRLADGYKAKILSMFGAEDHHPLSSVHTVTLHGIVYYKYSYIHTIDGIPTLDKMTVTISEYGELSGYSAFLLGVMADVTLPDTFSKGAVINAMAARVQAICASKTDKTIHAVTDPAGWYVLLGEDGKPLVLANISFGTFVVEDDVIGNRIEFVIIP